MRAASGPYLTTSVALADVNGDGKLDIVVSNLCVTPCSPWSVGAVGVLLGNGDGTFQPAVTFGSGGDGLRDIEVGDLNADGKPDIVAVNGCIVGSNCPFYRAEGIGRRAAEHHHRPYFDRADVVSDPSNFGQTVALTATVSVVGFYKPPTHGTVTFFADGKSLGSSSLNNSVAVLNTSKLAVGTHILTATYAGNAKFASNSSPSTSQLVQGAVVQLSTSSLHFGNQTVAMVSNAQTVTLTNIGNVTLAASAAIKGTDQNDFTETDNCSSVAPSSSCTISVTFKPATTGWRSAALTIADNASKSPQKVSLVGTGVLPHVTFSPAGLTFPTQVVYTPTKCKP